MTDPSIHGTRRLVPLRFLVTPLPKVDAALRSVAEELDSGDKIDKRVAEILRKVADEMHFWM